MSVNNKRVFYVKYLAHQIYADILKARPDVRLDRLENESPEETFAPILSAAHAYQIGAARDELARHFHVDQDLLRRAPNLLIVSSNGAGYDPVDVEACTEAGAVGGDDEQVGHARDDLALRVETRLKLVACGADLVGVRRLKNRGCDFIGAVILEPVEPHIGPRLEDVGIDLMR